MGLQTVSQSKGLALTREQRQQRTTTLAVSLNETYATSHRLVFTRCGDGTVTTKRAMRVAWDLFFHWNQWKLFPNQAIPTTGGSKYQIVPTSYVHTYVRTYVPLLLSSLVEEDRPWGWMSPVVTQSRCSSSSAHASFLHPLNVAEML